MNSIVFANHKNIVPLKGKGKVEQEIKPLQPGRVYYRATYWPAQFSNLNCTAKVLPGDSVKVVGRQGLTLLVLPNDSITLSQY